MGHIFHVSQHSICPCHMVIRLPSFFPGEVKRKWMVRVLRLLGLCNHCIGLQSTSFGVTTCKTGHVGHVLVVYLCYSLQGIRMRWAPSRPVMLSLLVVAACFLFSSLTAFPGGYSHTLCSLSIRVNSTSHPAPSISATPPTPVVLVPPGGQAVPVPLRGDPRGVGGGGELLGLLRTHGPGRPRL